MEPAKDPPAESSQPKTSEPRLPSRRRSIAIGVASCVVIYLALAVCGVIKRDNRLNAAEMVLLALAGLVVVILLTPNFLERITKLKFSDFEIELDRIQKDQQQQKADLDGVRFVLSLLLKTEEVAHLRNLHSGDVQHYVGNGSVRTELGKLLELRLIERLPGRGLRQIKDNAQFVLSDFVRITTPGERCLERLAELKPSPPNP